MISIIINSTILKVICRGLLLPFTVNMYHMMCNMFACILYPVVIVLGFIRYVEERKSYTVHVTQLV